MMAQRAEWSVRSRWSCAIVFVCLAAINVAPVLSTAGAPLAIIAVAIAVFDPFAAFLYIAASQIAPDPPGIPLSLAQLFVVAWVAAIPFSGVLNTLNGIPRGMRYCSVFIVMWTAIAIINDTIIWDFVYAFIFAAIAATYVPLMRGAYVRALWMLALGATLGFAGYWGNTLGLPMTGKVYDHAIRGGDRMGSGRGDVNWASVNVGLGMWMLIALLIPYIWAQTTRNAHWLTLLAAAIFIAGAIPLIVMGSRGGLAYLILGGLFVVTYALVTRRFAAKAASAVTIAALTLLLLGPFVGFWFIETEPGQRLLATIEFNRLQADQYGTGEGVAGRSNQWFAFLDITAKYPLAGVPLGEVVDFGEYGTAAVGEGAGGGAHNVWLDIAAGRGIPVALLFAIAFAAPMIALWRRRGSVYAFPFAAAHAVIFLAFMNLSIANYKTYWALHVLTASAAYVPRTQRFVSARTAIGRHAR